MPKLIALLAVMFLFLSGSCKPRDEALTAGEARQAIEESALSSQAATLVNGTVEISTNFTIGQAVEQAAQELREFITSQLPCAEITVANATLTIEYGANDGSCTWHGHTYSGSHSVTIDRNNEGDVVVNHVWDELSNHVMSVTGTATVTWSFAEGSRNVAHQLTWTRLFDGRQGVGSGNRTQTLLPGGIAEGIEINGGRNWEGEAGQWDLDIDGVEVRWTDPVPQAGTYSLITPFGGKSLALIFERVDEDTIEVTVSSGDHDYSFLVSKLGLIEEA
jgi:hypothetical protein